MEDMLSETNSVNCPASAAAIARDLADLLREHRGGGVSVLDLRGMNAWADFFVIATAASGIHLGGMERHIKEFCRQRGLDILRHSRKPGTGADEWRLIDLGTVVIHLMSERARAFYELERLWARPAAAREDAAHESAAHESAAHESAAPENAETKSP